MRFYERVGLLPRPPRSPGGFRRYPLSATERLQLIRYARVLGLSLADIEALLDDSAECGSERAQRRERAFAAVQLRADAIGHLQALRPGGAPPSG